MQSTDADTAQTLTCSLILLRIDYCNSVLHGTPPNTIQKLQRAQNNEARVVSQASPRYHFCIIIITIIIIIITKRRRNFFALSESGGRDDASRLIHLLRV